MIKDINDKIIVTLNVKKNTGSVIGVYIDGVSDERLKEIGIEIFEKKLDEFSSELREQIVLLRDELLSEILFALSQKNNNEKDIFATSFEEPSFHIDLFKCQNEYIYNKSDDLKKMLSEMFVYKYTTDDSIFSLTLGECISVVGKLTRVQLDVLSFITCLLTFHFDFKTKVDFYDFLNKCVVSQVEAIKDVKFIDYKHLNYTGCCSQATGEYPFYMILDKYKNLFEYDKNYDSQKFNNLAEYFIHDAKEFQCIVDVWKNNLNKQQLSSVGILIGLFHFNKKYNDLLDVSPAMLSKILA